MKQFESMTVEELILALKHMVKNGEVSLKSKILLSSDSEGNGYGTLCPPYSFGKDGISDTLFLYPGEEFYVDDLYSEEDYKKMGDSE